MDEATLSEMNKTNLATVAESKDTLGVSLALLIGSQFVLLTNWKEVNMVSPTGYFVDLAKVANLSHPKPIVICSVQGLSSKGTVGNRAILLKASSVVYGLCRAEVGGETWDTGPEGPYSQGLKSLDNYVASVFEDIADAIGGDTAVTNLLVKVAAIVPTATWFDQHPDVGQPFGGMDHLGAIFGPDEFIVPAEWQTRMDTWEVHEDFTSDVTEAIKSIGTKSAEVTLSLDIPRIGMQAGTTCNLGDIITAVCKAYKPSQTAYDGKSKKALVTLKGAVEAAEAAE